MKTGQKRMPEALRPLFWDREFSKLDPERNVAIVLARVLEFGRMEDVRWAIRRYGMKRIHWFFREVGHPEITERTRTFWRAVLRAKDERWPGPPAWRKPSGTPWSG